MPSWKRVIVSGSDAALNSLNVSTSLTASGIIYPTADGTSNQVIKTDGNGNLFFDNVLTTTISIKNVSGGTILKGTPCYITGSGTSGNLAGVFPADASNPLRMPAGVIAGEDLNDGDEGIGLLNGFINGVDTSAFNAGDSVYVAVGGGYTNVRPTGSSVLIQKLGNVEKSHASNGSGVINGPGYYNEVPNIQQGYTWVGNSNGVAVAVATSSIQNVVSSSFATTSTTATQTSQAVTFNNGGAGATSGTTFNGSTARTISYNTIGAVPTGRTLTINGTAYDLSANRSWSVGTVTSVAGTGGYGGLTLSGTVTSTGNITLGGTPTGTWPISVSGNASTATSASYAATSSWAINAIDANDADRAASVLIVNDTSTNATYYPAFMTATSGHTPVRVDNTGLTYNPSTNTLTTTTFAGALSGNASTATTASYALTAGSTAAVAGTTNYVSKFTSGTTIGNSLIYDNGTNVGIGTTSPSQKLDVVGKIALNDGGNSVFVGTDAGLNDDASNNRNVGIGYQTLYSNTTGNSNTANGSYALYSNISGYYNTANGSYALYSNTTAIYNTANGYRALYSNTTGNYNTVNGPLTLYSNTTGVYNTANGYQAGRYIANGTTANTTGDYNVFLGANTKALADNDQNEIVIGYNTTGLGSNTVVLGNDSIVTTALKGNVGIGTTTPSATLDIQGDISIKSANLSNQENLDVDTGTEVVATVAIADYDAAFFDFVIKNGTNLRAGTVYAVHDGTNVEYTETSTSDLGNTSDVTLSVDISSGNMRLLATTTSDNWIIKSLVRAI